MNGLLPALALAASANNWVPRSTPVFRPGQECQELPGIGCVYKPPQVRGAAHVLVYYRGHYRGSDSVGVGERLRSARQALTHYDLKKTVDHAGMVIVVTGSSNAPVGDEELRKAEELSGVDFADVYLASHSGGYVGLHLSLGRLRRVKRIIMLDNFYFGTDLTELIAGRVQGGAGCAGFATQHNQGRWAQRFAGRVRCPVAVYEDPYHDTLVNSCLGHFIVKDHCE